MRKQAIPLLGAAFGVPAAFAIAAQLTDVGVERLSFYPSLGYWLLLMCIALITGVSVMVRGWAGEKRRRFVVGMIYAALMTVVLIVIQGLISCGNGDCI